MTDDQGKRELHAELLLELWEDRLNSDRRSNFTDPVYVVVDGVSHLVDYAEETRDGMCRFILVGAHPLVCEPTTILEVIS